MANTAASLWQSHVFPVRHTETDVMAMGGGTTTIRTPPAAAATATSRGSTSSSTSSSGGDDAVVRSSSARPHARSVPDAKSARVPPHHHHYQQRDHFLLRMGSRSLNEDYSTTSSLSEESEDANGSVDGGRLRNSLPERSAASSASDASLTVRHGTDPHLDDRYYAMLRDSGNFVKMGWLTKQGHVWKNWKSRFFVLFRDGTLAYYKAKNKRRMKGCIKLNDGVVSIQHLDIRKSQKPYVFQVEKGFYRMWCCCCSQLEAELWVNALRDVRQSGPPCFEPLLTVPEEQLGCAAVNRQLNKIFVTDRRIMSMLQAHKNSIVPHTVDGVYIMIGRLEDAILDRYQGYLYMDPEVELLSGNELVKLLRRHVEDRAFVPVASFVYAGLENNKIRAARTRIARNTKLLKNKSQRDLGVPSEIADISGDWTHAIVIVDALDCTTLISHKIDLIVNAANSIEARVAQYHGALAEISDETLTAIFRYVLVKSSLDDIAVLHALLKPVYLHHPACQNRTSVLAAFIDAICWLDSYKVANDDDPSANMANGVSLASSRVDVSISTADVGILFTTDGNGRGAIVHTVRKLSQAALSEKIVQGLSLIAINDEPVILMPFREICQRLRTAALPKRLTFLPEFFYYQLLSLDSDMYHYLLCLAAGRGDKDSVSCLMGSQLDVSELSTWEQTRGPQVLGFTPPSSRGSALHAAVHNCHYAMVDYLLRLGAKPNLEDRHGRTPLHMLPASGFEIVPVIQELQSSGANLDAKDGEGVTPLMAMARRGSMEGVTTLLALGAKLDAIAWSTGYSALEYAVVYGSIDVTELLLSKGADPNHATLDGDTSLHLASTAGDAEMLQVLVNAGGDVNKQNRFGQSPAACLLSQSSHRLQEPAKDCLTILLQAGDAQKPDLLGRHLLHLAQLSNDDSVRQLMQELCLPRDSRIDSCADIFGCTARDYDAGVGNDQVHWRMRHPRELLSWSSKDLTGKARRQSSLAKSKSFDELMETLLHDVSVDLADLVAFVMFLDSFSSLGAVVNYLREFILNGSQARNVLRFILVLLLFKLRHARDGDAIVGEIQSLLEQHRRRMPDKTVILLDDYRTMFAQYFTLQGSTDCLEHYSSLPIAMQHRYGGDQPSNFSTVFPRNIFIQVEPSQWAEHCTLLTHTLFCSIPVTDFVSVGSKAPHSPQFVSAKRWFQHLTAYVVNAVLIEDSREGRVEVIDFFLAAAESCLTLRNYDTLAAILYALQSTAVQRLRRTVDALSVASKKLLSKMQGLSDKGCRDVNKIMHAAENPSMPYIGLYLQGFVGLNELPVFEKADLINGGRLRKMGELAVEILHRRSVAYHLSFFEDVDSLLHVQLPFPTDESRYSRSLQLEPREAGAAPLGDRATYVAADDLDLDNEVRESIGAEGTFGIRQWFRMQKVVHRNRSRSATQAAVYEWV